MPLPVSNVSCWSLHNRSLSVQHHVHCQANEESSMAHGPRAFPAGVAIKCSTSGQLNRPTMCCPSGWNRLSTQQTVPGCLLLVQLLSDQGLTSISLSCSTSPPGLLVPVGINSTWIPPDAVAAWQVRERLSCTSSANWLGALACSTGRLISVLPALLNRPQGGGGKAMPRTAARSAWPKNE